MNTQTATTGFCLADESRCRRLIDRAREQMDLSLDGLTVLTEAATGYYALTPIMAALAGARCVFMLARDSRHGSARQSVQSVLHLAHRWGVHSVMIPLESRHDACLREVDVITNLGAVRPIDAGLLDCLKPRASIALMWEPWEFRPEDIDLSACRARDFPVLGTNEQHELLRIFDYVGLIAVKLLLTVGIECFRSRVVLLGNGPFAGSSARTLSGMGADVFLAGSDQDPDHLLDLVRSADALVIMEHLSRHPLIGRGAAVSGKALASANPSLLVCHIAGRVDLDDLLEAGLRCVPERFAPAGFMSLATDYVGPRPLIDLHTAGLVVGAALARSRGTPSSGSIERERAVLACCPLAQGFPDVYNAKK